MTEPKTHTLEVPGAVLHYDVRPGPENGAGPVLLLIGSPMGAAGFATLAGHFTDRTVVTYDPRGAERSRRTDGATVNTVEEHADDLHRLISALDAGPVDVFGSSGGASNALALVARHPEQVRTLVAHEPPITQVLPDREHARAATTDIRRTYEREGLGPAMAKFIALLTHEGAIPADFPEQRPDPAAFGLPTEDDGSRDDPLMLNLGDDHEHDLDGVRAASTRVVIGVGAASRNLLPGRAAVAVAEQLGTEVVTFPGDHGGFLGGEYGQTGEPDAFAATLREVLDGGSDPSRYASGAGSSL